MHTLVTTSIYNHGSENKHRTHVIKELVHIYITFNLLYNRWERELLLEDGCKIGECNFACVV
jgi:hypothetical protein